MTDTPELVDMLGNVSISDNKDKKFVYDVVRLLIIFYKTRNFLL